MGLPRLEDGHTKLKCDTYPELRCLSPVQLFREELRALD
jgi:hypothetical protein